ncbi:MAG: hypothetical protein ACTSQE_15175 [Candidatus Heimdallarchaeaceae archaeon]
MSRRKITTIRLTSSRCEFPRVKVGEIARMSNEIIQVQNVKSRRDVSDGLIAFSPINKEKIMTTIDGKTATSKYRKLLSFNNNRYSEFIISEPKTKGLNFSKLNENYLIFFTKHFRKNTITDASKSQDEADSNIHIKKS